MDALDLLFLLAGLMAAAAVLAGCVVCLVVWLAGRGAKDASEVCPPADES